jgi:predicted dehydrogenase
MQAIDRPLRIGILGTGSWARRTHIPHLLRLPRVEICALADPAAERLESAAAEFGITSTYEDGLEMVEREDLDILYSVVPAYARTNVEATAASRGVHLFSEKPQALDMATARRIDDAISRSGVLSTVCFRERYRPLFQEARRLLADKEIVHARFQSFRNLPVLEGDVDPEQRDSWNFQMDKAGGAAFDWGVHAVDYMRFMTRLDIAAAQAFYHHPSVYNKPLSCSFNFGLGSGATMTVTFTSSGAAPSAEAPFTVFYVGGYLSLWMYDRIELNGQVVYKAEEFDPWFEQDRIFVEAVRSGDPSGILNDYHDGLSSLAPILAGWESSRRGGQLVDVSAFAAA